MRLGTRLVKACRTSISRLYRFHLPNLPFCNVCVLNSETRYQWKQEHPNSGLGSGKYSQDIPGVLHQLHSPPTALASYPGPMTRQFEYGMLCQAFQPLNLCSDASAEYVRFHFLPVASMSSLGPPWGFKYGIQSQASRFVSPWKDILIMLIPWHTLPMAVALSQ